MFVSTTRNPLSLFTKRQSYEPNQPSNATEHVERSKFLDLAFSAAHTGSSTRVSLRLPQFSIYRSSTRNPLVRHSTNISYSSSLLYSVYMAFSVEDLLITIGLLYLKCQVIVNAYYTQLVSLKRFVVIAVSYKTR